MVKLLIFNSSEKEANLFSLVPSLLAILISVVFLIFQYPFSYNTQNLVKVVATVLTLINLPTLLYLGLKRKYILDFYYFITASSVLVLVVFMVLGLLHLTLLTDLLLILGICSFVVVLINSIRYYTLRVPIYTLLLIPLVFWMCGLVWGIRGLSPLFNEKVFMNYWNEPIGALDSFFHMSITQMIKTYGTPSSGLDELPYLPYHYGSHFIFAMLSRSLNCSVLELYTFGFPIIFFPLLVFIIGVVFHQYKSLSKDTSVFGFVFWFCLLSIIIGFLPNNHEGLAYRTTLAWDSIAISESYMIAITFLLIFFSLFIFPLIVTGEIKSNLLFILPLILVPVAGISKISVLVIICTMLGYLYLRLRWYKSGFYTIVMLCVIIVSYYLYTLSRNPINHDGEFEWLAYYTKYVHADFDNYIFIPLIWTFITFILFLIVYNKKLKTNSLLIEVHVIAAFVGFLPGLLLNIAGGSAFYFSDIQHWIAFPVIGYFLPTVINNIRIRYRVGLGGLGIVMMFYCYSNSLNVFEKFFNESIEMKGYIMTGAIIPKIKLEYSQMSEIRSRMKVMFDDSLKIKEQRNAGLALVGDQIGFLSSLDTLPDKSKKILFLTSDSLLSRFIPCNKLPFIISSLTGLASFDGYSVVRCPWQNYGVAYYTREAPITKNQDICPLLTDKRFKEVVYCNVDSMTYRIVPCK